MKPAHRLPSDPPRRLQTPWCEKAEICLAKNRKCREDDQYAFYYGGKIFSLVVTIGMLIACVERVRVRDSGATLFMEIAVSVSRSLPLNRVAAQKAEITEAVQKRFPGAELTIVADPRALDNETIETRVRVIAANQGAAIHRLTIQRIEEKLSISLDLEVAADMSARSAHGVASGLEAAIREEIGPDTEIVSTRQVEGALASPVVEGGVVRDVHDICIRKTEIGLIVNFHCRVPAGLLITEAHNAVDEVERRVRTLYPGVARMVGYAEPAFGS